jgi:hypothetical protein
MRSHRVKRSRIRWPWIAAVALGWLIGLTVAAWFGVTGARLGPPDAFDRAGIESPSDRTPSLAGRALPSPRPRTPTH